MKKILFSLLTILMTTSLFAAGVTYYSLGNFDVKVLSSWNTDRTGAGALPANFSDGDIFVIQNGHSMFTSAAWGVTGSANKLQIESGGMLTATFIVSTLNFQVDNGGTYIHDAQNTGAYPANGTPNDIPGTGTGSTRTFGTSSNVEIRKWANGGAIPNGLPQVSWGNLVIDVAWLNGNWVQQNTTMGFTALGNLTIKQTGGNLYAFKLTSGGGVDAYVGGNLNIEGGRMVLSQNSGTNYANLYRLTVNGNIVQTGGSFTLNDLASGNTIYNLNVTGNVTVSGGYFSAGGFYAGGNTSESYVTGVSSTAGLIVGWGIAGPGMRDNNLITGLVGSDSIAITSNKFAAASVSSPMFAGPTFSGTTTSGSATITGATGTGLVVGMSVGGPGIPVGTTIVAVNGTDITLSQGATASATVTLVPGVVSFTGNTATNSAVHVTMVFNGNLTVDNTGLFSFGTGLRAASLVLGGNLYVAPTASFKNTNAWFVSSGTASAAIYFKGGNPTATLSLPPGVSTNGNISFVVAPGKTVTLNSDLTTGKFVSVAGVLDIGSYVLTGTIDTLTNAAMTFTGDVGASNQSQVKNPSSAVGLKVGMEITSTTPGLLQPHTVLTKVTDTLLTFTPAATSGTTAFTAAVFNVGPAAGLVLPLHLIAFRGSLIDKNVKLVWSTENEKSLKEFAIEKSFNGIEFSKIGSVKATNLPTINYYNYTDASGLKASNFYRLKMIDMDGAFTYSSVVRISNGINTGKVAVYPNPVTNTITIGHEIATGSGAIKIVSVDGKVVAAFSVSVGSTQTSFDVSGLAKGQYVVSYNNGGLVSTSTFMK